MATQPPPAATGPPQLQTQCDRPRPKNARNGVAARMRRRRQLLLSVLASLPAWSCCPAELFPAGDFSLPLSAAQVGPDAAGAQHVARPSADGGSGGGAMRPFPGSATTALQLRPPLRGQEPAPRFQLLGAAAPHASGWYRVRWFAAASKDYNGREGFETQVVGGDGAPLWPSRVIQLREHRDEWLFYEQYVSANMVLGVLDGFSNAMLSACRFTMDPGAGFTRGSLQITGLSIEFVEVLERPGLAVIDLCQCSTARTGADGLCGSAAAPSCGTSAGCPIAELGDSESYPTSGTCQDSFVHLSGTTPAAAYDGVIDPDSIGWYIAGNAASVIWLTLTMPGGAVPVCAATITFARWSYPQRWRLGANSNPNESYRTWVSAGRVSGSTGRDWRTARARGATWISSGGGAIDLALDCEDAWNVRLEMEDARGAAREMQLIEMELRTAITPGWLTCDCRHGGVCAGDGCECPLDVFGTCETTECGWTGAECEVAGCVPALTCHNLGGCGGPNTCDCAPGWHGTAGLEQCLVHQCGDGGLSPLTGEECDDGNAVDGDGCDSSCAFEPLPA